MKYVFVFICFLSFFDAESQEFSGMFSTTINEKDASYSAVDNSNADLAVFFINRSKSKVVLLNSATTFQDSLSAKSITKYKKLVAQNLYNSSAQLVYSNNDFSSFLIQIFDFKEKKDSIIKFDFDSDSNCLLQLFYLNDTFYLISLKNSNKNLILTSVSKKGEVTVKELSAENVLTQKILLNFSAYTYSEKNKKFLLTWIKEKQYNGFSQTKSLSKCYLQDSVFVATLDFPSQTDILSLNLRSNTLDLKTIDRENILNFTSFNSLLIEKKLIQISHNNNSFNLVLKDISGKIIKILSEDISNKVVFFAEEELGKIDQIDSKKYYKKVNKAEIGLSYFQQYTNSYLHFGSESKAYLPIDDENMKFSQIGFLTGGLVGALLGTLLDSAIHEKNSYSNYIANGQTYGQLKWNSNYEISESFNKDFSHSKLKKQIIYSNSFTVPTIFYVNDMFHLGYYNSKENRYFFRKFK